ncbi:MAG: heavy-metal-associated domain-containing protein, partial [Bacteroidota bacterium]
YDSFTILRILKALLPLIFSYFRAMEIYLENIKCGGCGNSIVKAITPFAGITDVKVSPEENKVTLSGEDFDLEAILEKVKQLGYPQAGENSFIHKAKSYASCMVGRVNT